jgi:signal transduction histidine kinase
LTTQVPEPAATAAYRIVQEALTNAGRHSAASSVVVYLTAEEGLLRVTIHDDGQGFDAAGGKPGHRSSGLSGMRDRAQAAGGSLEIHSAPGEGTIVMAEFALLTVAEERAE